MKIKRIPFLSIVLLIIAASGKAPQPDTAITNTPGNQILEWSQVSFYDLAPTGMDMQQCWNGMGMDDQGQIYIGFTSAGRFRCKNCSPAHGGTR